MFQVFVRSPSFWVSLCVLASFWIWAPLFDTGKQTEALRVFLIAFAAATGVLWLKGVARILTKRKPIEGQQLTLGIVIVALSLAGGSAWLLVWRLAGQPSWMVNSLTNAFFLWMGAVGYVLHLLAPRPEGHDISWPQHLVLLASLAVAAVVSALVVYVQPDMTGLAEWLRRYMA